MLTHRTSPRSAISNVAEGIVMPGGVTLFAAPMFHLANGAAMLASMNLGNTTAFVPSSTPTGAAESIENEGASQMLLVPTMIQMLVDHPDLEEVRHPRALRQVLDGASAHRARAR
jgi:acyl-CoA synthetase (AMP-forming)/AMP-acid ligase II